MNFEEFAEKVIKRYPPKKEDIEKDEDFIADFVEAININGDIDYEKAFIDLMRSYSYSCLPSAKFIVEVLSSHRKRYVPSYARFCTLLATDKAGHEFEYGVEPSVGEILTVRALERQGFTNIRRKFAEIEKKNTNE